MLALALVSLAMAWPDPWAGSEGLDVVTISEGEPVDIEASLAPDHFTVVDFGAGWCSPCHDAAQALKLYLADHPDVAVRVISLPGEAAQSVAAPVVAQHLGPNARLPTLWVYSPSGRRIYRGHRVKRAIRVIERRR